MKKLISMVALAAMVSALSFSSVYAEDTKDAKSCEKKESSCCKKKDACCKKDAKAETAQPEKK